MEYNFNLGIFGGVFAVPHCVVDEYIKIATGDNLKVLLYCLRHAGQELSVGEISRATGIPPDNVTTSLEFWRQRQTTSEDVNAGAPPPVKSSPALIERDYDFSPKEISDTIKSSKDVDYLFKRCEELYGRPLKHNEQKALAVIIEEYGMKPEVALMLMEYCFSIDKNTTFYIKKTAKNWIEQGINSVVSAESEIKHLKEFYSAEGELKRLLNVREIPESRKPLFKKWLFEQRHSNETIYSAYQKALEKTGKLEYTYMDKILTGLIEGTNKPAVSNVRATMSLPSFDLDELDKQIMEEYKKQIEDSKPPL